MDKLRADEPKECLNFVHMWAIMCHIDRGTQAERSGENGVQELF